MAHDDATRRATGTDGVPMRLLATRDAVLPDVEDCTVRTTDDVGRALAREDLPELVVLGPHSTPATVTDAIRRLRGGRTRTWLVCQGALPRSTSGSVTTVAGHDRPERAVERALYLAAVDRHGTLARRAARSGPSEATTCDPVARAATVRTAYAGRLDGDDFATLYSRL
jgi:hypothetical protein